MGGQQRCHANVFVLGQKCRSPHGPLHLLRGQRSKLLSTEIEMLAESGLMKKKTTRVCNILSSKTQTLLWPSGLASRCSGLLSEDGKFKSHRVQREEVQVVIS